jgi:hypothetical protein
MDPSMAELAADALHPFLEPHIKASISRQIQEEVVPTMITEFDTKFQKEADRIESSLHHRCTDAHLQLGDRIEDILKSQSSFDDWKAMEDDRMRTLEKQLVLVEKKAVRPYLPSSNELDDMSCS